MEYVGYFLGGVAALILLRILLRIRYIRNAQKQQFYQEYATVLNDPKYKVKSNYE